MNPRFCPCRAHFIALFYPGRCPGLCACWAFSPLLEPLSTNSNHLPSIIFDHSRTIHDHSHSSKRPIIIFGNSRTIYDNSRSKEKNENGRELTANYGQSFSTIRGQSTAIRIHQRGQLLFSIIHGQFTTIRVLKRRTKMAVN